MFQFLFPILSLIQVSVDGWFDQLNSWLDQVVFPAVEREYHVKLAFHVTRQGIEIGLVLLCLAVMVTGFTIIAGGTLGYRRRSAAWHSLRTLNILTLLFAFYSEWRLSVWWSVVPALSLLAEILRMVDWEDAEEMASVMADEAKVIRLCGFLPYEVVDRDLNSNREIREVLKGYDVFNCSVELEGKRVECVVPTRDNIPAWCSKYSIKNYERLLAVLRTIRFEVRMDFDPMLRNRSGLIPSHYDSAYYAPLRACHRLFETGENVRYTPRYLMGKRVPIYENKLTATHVKKTQQNGIIVETQEEVYEDVEVGSRLKVVRKAEVFSGYKNIGDMVPYVTAERSCRIANGNLVYANAVTKGELIYYAQDDVVFRGAGAYRTALYDPEIVSACLHNVQCDLTETLKAYAARRLEGNALHSSDIEQLVTGVVEVAQIAYAHQMARVLAGKAGTMSVRKAKLCLGMNGVKNICEFKAAGETRENQKLVDQIVMDDKEYESSALCKRRFMVFMIGLALSAETIRAVSAVRPENPAKREPIIISPRKEPAVTPSRKIHLAGPEMAFPFYDRKDAGVVKGSYLGRICKDNGAATQEGCEHLLRAVKYAFGLLQPPKFENITLTHKDLENWVCSRKTWNQAKRDRHLSVIPTMPEEITWDYLKSVSKMEAFIKDEAYAVSAIPHMRTTRVKVKAPRNICDRSMEFKMVAGACMQRINDWFFEHDFCIKHIPQQLRGQYIADRFEGKGRCLTTDHSAFESSATGVCQMLCEGLFYRAMLPRECWFVHDVICQPNWIRNKNTGEMILTDTVRYSGDITTSLGNSLANMCSAIAAYAVTRKGCNEIELPELDAREKAWVKEIRMNFGQAALDNYGRKLKALGDPIFTDFKDSLYVLDQVTRSRVSKQLPLTFLVEGDDAIVAAPDLADRDVYQKAMCSMGFNVTIEESEDASKAGFCSIYWQVTPRGIVTYVNPINNIINASWSTTVPTRKMPADELYKAKLRSVLDMFPNCPVVWKLLQGQTTAVLNDTYWNRVWLMQNGTEFRSYNGWLFYEAGEVSEPTDEDRAMFHELYGLSPAAQRELEIEPVQGLTDLIRFCVESGRATDLEDYCSQYGSYNVTETAVVEAINVSKTHNTTF